MLRKLVLPALALVALPTIASAQFEAGDWELTLSGTMSVSKDTKSDIAGATVEVGYFATKELEVSVRQTIQHFSTDANGTGQFTAGGNVISESDGQGWRGVTVGALDYHFDLGRFQPFIGVFGGYDYSNQNTTVTVLDNAGFIVGQSKVDDDSFVAGPEVGVKYFVNGTTFVYARAAYVYWFDDKEQSTWDGSLGVGFRF